MWQREVRVTLVSEGHSEGTVRNMGPQQLASKDTRAQSYSHRKCLQPAIRGGLAEDLRAVWGRETPCLCAWCRSLGQVG